MSDTVAASILSQSLGDTGPTFILGPSTSSATTDSGSPSAPGAMHVSGGVQAVDLVSGFGAPLLVDFVTAPPPAAVAEVVSPTVGGYGAGAFSPDDAAPVVVGAMHGAG